MSEPTPGSSLDEARRAAQAGAKPDHDPTVPEESPALLEQAVGRSDPRDPRNPLDHREPGEVGDPDEDDAEADGDEGEEWEQAETGEASPLPDEVPLAPIAQLDSLPAFQRLDAGLAEPLHLRSPERFLAAAIETALQPRGGDGGRISESVTSLQPWAETGASAGRNKRPLAELLAEYAARVAADPLGRAGAPEGRHPADVYLDRFRSGGGRSPVGATGIGERRGDRAGRRGRRSRGGERPIGAETTQPPLSAGDAQVGPSRSAGGRAGAPTPPVGAGATADSGRPARTGRRSGGRRRGGGRGGGERNRAGESGSSPDQARPSAGSGPEGAAGGPTGTGPPRSSASRRRSRGRGRGRGPGGGGGAGGGTPSGGGGTAG